MHVEIPESELCDYLGDDYARWLFEAERVEWEEEQQQEGGGSDE